jgi:hypothetical protein
MNYLEEFLGKFVETGLILYLIFVVVDFVGSFRDWFKYRVRND